MVYILYYIIYIITTILCSCTSVIWFKTFQSLAVGIDMYNYLCEVVINSYCYSLNNIIKYYFRLIISENLYKFNILSIL